MKVVLDWFDRKLFSNHIQSLSVTTLFPEAIEFLQIQLLSILSWSSTEFLNMSF